MSTGFTLEGFPSMGAWVSVRRWGPRTRTCRPTWRSPTRGRPAARAGELDQRFPAGRVPGDGVQRRAAHQPPVAAGDDQPRRRRGDPRLPPADQRRAPPEQPGRFLTVGPDPVVRAGGADAGQHPGGHRLRLGAPAIQRLYGLDRPETAGFGRNCLLARRLLERGVRFVQLFHGGAFGSPRINWDAHEDVVENHYQAGGEHGPARWPASSGTSSSGACSTRRWFSGPPSSAGRRSPRGSAARDATTINWRSPAGWPARGSSRAIAWRIGRGRLPGRAGPRLGLRLPRDRPPPAGDRPQAADLLPQRHPAPADGRPRRGDHAATFLRFCSVTATLFTWGIVNWVACPRPRGHGSPRPPMPTRTWACHPGSSTIGDQDY